MGLRERRIPPHPAVVVSGEGAHVVLAARVRHKCGEISLRCDAAFVCDTLRRARVKRVTLALEPRDGCGVGVARPDVEPFTVLAGLVCIYKTKGLVEALVDGRRR